MTLGLRSSDAYLELLKAFPPRPITSEDELHATQRVIDALLDQAELTPDERDYLNVLGTLVYEYEQKHNPMPNIYGVELLKAVMAEANLESKDLLPIFKTEANVFAILNGQQELTLTQIQELATLFHLSPAAFFEQNF